MTKRNRFTISFFIALAFLKFISLQAQENSNQDLINFLFKDYIGEKPSASFVVIKDGQIKKCQSFGYADFENKILASCETNYRSGSVAKQFTAMAVMILIEKGKLSLETKLQDVLPDFPDYGKAITIQHLLTHRSGLLNYEKLFPKDINRQLNNDDVFNLLKKQDSLYFPVGSKARYSNSGYALLALIVERISGKPYRQFMNEEIFQKIVMSNTTVYEKEILIKNRAYGYRFNKEKSKFWKKDQSKTSAVKGDGCIYSSVKDFVMWDKALRENILISEGMKQKVFTPWNKNVFGKGEDYGFGWFLGVKNNIKYMCHGGSTVGFRNYVLRIPELNMAVAIFTNSNLNTRNNKRKMFALASMYSEGKLPIAMDLLFEKEISEQGSKHLSKFYKKLKESRGSHEVNKKDLTSLSFRYFKKEEMKHCFNVLSFLTKEFPNDFNGYFGLAEYYKKKDDTKRALENYNKVIELASKETNKRQIDYAQKCINELGG